MHALCNPTRARRGRLFLGTLTVVVGMPFTLAHAQQQPTPQQRYERQLAYCNSGQLPDPARNACVRDAGNLLDRSVGGPPPSEVNTSQDGRATIVSPEGLPQPNSGSDDITSRDGRATIVLPANQQPPK